MDEREPGPLECSQVKPSTQFKHRGAIPLLLFAASVSSVEVLGGGLGGVFATPSSVDADLSRLWGLRYLGLCSPKISHRTIRGINRDYEGPISIP